MLLLVRDLLEEFVQIIRFRLIKADVLVDIECDAKHLDKVIRLLKCEVQSVNYTATQSGDEFPPPLSACSSFGMTQKLNINEYYYSMIDDMTSCRFR